MDKKMKNITKATAIIATSLLLATPALAQAPAPHGDHPAAHGADHAPTGSGCFRTNDIKNHTVAEDGAIYLKVNINDVYRVTTTNRCARPFDRSNPLVIKTPASTGFVCKAIDLDLGINRNGFTSPCIVKDIVKLSPAEAAALPKKVRP